MAIGGLVVAGSGVVSLGTSMYKKDTFNPILLTKKDFKEAGRVMTVTTGTILVATGAGAGAGLVVGGLGVSTTTVVSGGVSLAAGSVAGIGLDNLTQDYNLTKDMTPAKIGLNIALGYGLSKVPF